MQSLGQTFHQLRKNKNLTLKEVADDEISVAVISKFENDQTMLGVDRFLHLLRQINVTTEDFFYRYRESDPQALQAGKKFSRNEMPLPEVFDVLEPFAELLAIVNTDKKDIEKCSDLQKYIVRTKSDLKSAPTLNNRMRLALAETAINEFQEKSFKSNHTLMLPITEYLSNVSVWSAFELILFITTSIFMDPDDAIQMFDRCMKQAAHYTRLSDLRYLGYSVCFTIFSAMVTHKRFGDAKRALDEFDNFLKKDAEAQFAIKSLFMHGWYLYIIGNKEDGKEKCITVLQLCHTLHLEEDRSEYQELLEQIEAGGRMPMHAEIFG